MAEIPMYWARVPLKELVVKTLGGDWGKGTDEAPADSVEVAVVRGTEFREWSTLRARRAPVRYLKRSSLEARQLQEGDLVIEVSGGGPTQPVGRVLLIDADALSSVERPLVCTNFCRQVRLSSEVDPRLVALALKWLYAAGAMSAIQTQTTNLRNLNFDEFLELEIPLPPLAEQKRIVAKVEELIARNRGAKEILDTVPPLLDQLRQSILAAALRGELTTDWRGTNPDVEPGNKLIGRIAIERRSRWEAIELAKLRVKGKALADDRWKKKYDVPAPAVVEDQPSLPTSWTWARVEELATKVVDGVHKKPNYVATGIPFLTVKNLTAGPGISFDELNYITPSDHEEYTKRTDPEPGDILISKDGTLGVARLVNTDRIFSIFVSLALVKPVFRKMGPFLELVFQSPIFQERFVSTGSGLQHIHLCDLRDAVLPVAPLAEQEEIVRRVGAVLNRVTVFENQLRHALEALAAMDNAILAKAFRGELVPQDPNDEPSSVLLERICAARASMASTEPHRRSRKTTAAAAAAVGTSDDNANDGVLRSATSSEPVEQTAKDISEFDQALLLDEVFAALWTHGPLEKDDVVRRIAQCLRTAGYVEFQRLRSDGPLYGQILAAIESAVRAGRLDRPKRGHVRACKADATAYTADDWRHALVASLGTEPMDRDEAIRAAAEWARDNLGLAFTRLRSDGHIVEGLRSAINSAIRRGEVIRHNATHISRAQRNDHEAVGQLSLTFSAGANRGDETPGL